MTAHTSAADQVLSGWGLYPRARCRVVRPSGPEEALGLVQTLEAAIPRGMGRSYGDASLAPVVLDTTALNRLLEFDSQSGVLYAEAGLSLDKLLRWSVPRGWFLPVVPGTKFITLGGALASDIHGKNHHWFGSFSRHIKEIELLTSGPCLKTCGHDKESELFEATAGGMGLTGMVLRMKLQMLPIETAYIRKTTYRAKNLEEILQLFDEQNAAAYSVAWIDGTASGKNLGRSLLFTGEHATRDQLPANLRKNPFKAHSAPVLHIPFHFPSLVLNHLTVFLFNKFYYTLSDGSGRSRIVHYDPYFFPLDAVNGWNKIYGRNGFLQYQFVLPRDKSQALKEILTRISRSGQASFLAVLKLFGSYTGRFLNFPMPGYTLAMDFPNRPAVHRLLDELDQLVLQAGGRLYLTKDARMKASSLAAQYPALEAFRRLQKEYDQVGLWQSCLSSRLALTSHSHQKTPCSPAS